jgi:aminotransferase EvaB
MIGKCLVPHALPHTEQACREVLSLPCFAELTDDELTRVADCCEAFFSASAIAA